MFYFPYYQNCNNPFRKTKRLINLLHVQIIENAISALLAGNVII